MILSPISRESFSMAFLALLKPLHILRFHITCSFHHFRQFISSTSVPSTSATTLPAKRGRRLVRRQPERYRRWQPHHYGQRLIRDRRLHDSMECLINDAKLHRHRGKLYLNRGRVALLGAGGRRARQAVTCPASTTGGLGMTTTSTRS